MADDHLGIVDIKTSELCQSLRNEAVTCTMEAVTADAVLLIIFFWNSIQICLWWHCLMECRIKYSNIRYPRHDLLACTDNKNIGRVMQRCQRTALLDLTDHILIDQYR